MNVILVCDLLYFEFCSEKTNTKGVNVEDVNEPKEFVMASMANIIHFNENNFLIIKTLKLFT